MPFLKVAKARDLPTGAMLAVEAPGGPVAVANVDGTLYAFDSLCTHAEGYLHEGFLDGFEVTCPMHFGAYDVRTGKATQPPCFVPIQTFPVRVSDEDIEIDVPAARGG